MGSNVSGVGTVWNLPNYSGMLFTADQINTPFLSIIGGLSNGGMITNNFEFSIDSLYSHNEPTQPAITETDSLTAPNAVGVKRGQTTNVCQIFHEQVSLSYERMANQGRLEGINTAGQQNSVSDEMNWQKARALEKIARDVNYTFINGAYQISTDAAIANKTRGILSATGNSIDANGAEFSKAILDELLLTMFNAGAFFRTPILWCNGGQKQKISDVYGFAPESRTYGGINIQTILTDFGVVGVALDRFMPRDTIAVVDVAYVSPVFQPVPKKGVLFYEELAKTGAGEKGQIFGKLGLNHGPAFLHGKITDLALSDADIVED